MQREAQTKLKAPADTVMVRRNHHDYKSNIKWHLNIFQIMLY